MIQINRILVPVDFSEFGKHAMRYGCELARRFSSELHLLHVVEDIYPMVPEAGLLLPAQTDFLTGLRQNAQKALEQLPPADIGNGITDVIRHVGNGTPFLEIIRYAREHNIDLIVIGTHGRSGLVHILMGSVAERIVRKSPCPVLTVRPEGHDFVMP
jgi:universal stress protein A